MLLFLLKVFFIDNVIINVSQSHVDIEGRVGGTLI